MKPMTTSAIALAAATIASPATAQNYGAAPAQQVPTAASGTQAPAATQPQIKLSGKASKAIIELQSAVKANDVANIPAKVAAAQAVAVTADDRYAIGRLQLNAALAAKNTEAAALAADYIAASNFLPKAQVAGLYNSLGVDFFNAKNPTRAVAMFQKAVTADPNNAESLRLLAETQNASGNAADSIATFQKAMQQAAATGQKLPEDSFKRAVSAAYKSKSPSAVAIARQWVAAYPSTDSWSNSVSIYRSLNQPGVGPTLDLLRLLRAVGALSTSGQYTLYATAAADQGNFGEAQAIIDEGLAAKRISTADATARDTIKGLRAKPKATTADLEAAAKIAATGASLTRVGDRFYGLGNYSRAADLYRQAVAKGGADANLAILHLGMALARAGDKAGATAALNAVTGANAEVAKYWLVYVNRAG